MNRKKQFVCLFLVAFAFLMASCGGGKKSQAQETQSESQQVKPDGTKITGRLGTLFTIEDKSYTLSQDKTIQSIYYISVSVERTSAEPAIPLEDIVSQYSDDAKAKYMGSFKVELFDANGDIVGQGDVSEDDFVKMMGLSEGEKATIKIQLSIETGDISTIKSFRISSSVEPNSNATQKTSDGLDESSSTDQNNNDADVDKDLDDLNKGLEATGKAMKAATEAAKAINDLSK